VYWEGAKYKKSQERFMGLLNRENEEKNPLDYVKKIIQEKNDNKNKN